MQVLAMAEKDADPATAQKIRQGQAALFGLIHAGWGAIVRYARACSGHPC